MAAEMLMELKFLTHLDFLFTSICLKNQNELLPKNSYHLSKYTHLIVFSDCGKIKENQNAIVITQITIDYTLIVFFKKKTKA